MSIWRGVARKPISRAGVGGFVPVLSASGVCKEYADRTVLDRVDLRLEPGRLTLVSGRSGSGKSTLFQILAGFERPDAGRVLFDEVDVARMGEAQRDDFRLCHVGVVFQDFRLLPDLTVVENIRLPLDLARRRNVGGDRRLSRSGARRRALELVQRFALDEVRDAFPETLSGGEQQRVAVARALANDPPIVLADEPTANLDELNAHTVMGLFRDAARSGRIVLVAAHDPLVVSYADAAWRLNSGRLVPAPVARRIQEVHWTGGSDAGVLRVPPSAVRSVPGPKVAPGVEEAG